MSEFIRANIVRANVANPIASNIVFQLDEMNTLEAATYKGADPHFTYKAFTFMLPMNDPQLVLFRDHMIDQVVIDAVTNAPRKYLIIGEPKIQTLTGSWQWVCTRMRGV